MYLERVLRGISGALMLAGAALTMFHSPHWIWFIALIGVMQAQSGFTDTCPMIWLLQKAGLRRCVDAPVRS